MLSPCGSLPGPLQLLPWLAFTQFCQLSTHAALLAALKPGRYRAQGPNAFIIVNDAYTLTDAAAAQDRKKVLFR